jgi:hypothetical protein
MRLEKLVHLKLDELSCLEECSGHKDRIRRMLAAGVLTIL